MNLQRILLLLTVAVLGLQQMVLSATDAKKDTLIVELDIYSGLPNPEYIITDPQEIKAFISLSDNITTRTDAFSDSIESEKLSKLGYRGFILTNVTGIPSLPEKMRIWKRDIIFEKISFKEAMTGETNKLLRHKGRGELMERWLIRKVSSEHLVNEETMRMLEEESK